MPTLSGIRRRGYTPEAIRDFTDRIGVAKRESIVDIALLEYCVRDDLNRRAPRVMGVLDPVKVIIDNYPEGQVEELEAINNPENPEAGVRTVPFSRELFIERDDFREIPPAKFHRLAPGREVRLRYGYFITCVDVTKDVNGEVIEIHCTYDPKTKHGYAPDGRKVKGTLHWVSAQHALNVEVRKYDRLFNKANPLDLVEGEDFLDSLNPNSLVIVQNCKVEPSLKDAHPGNKYQFERQGYFCVDPVSTSDNLVFNLTVSLKDTWAKIENKQGVK
jgi:glutaminyl-tRNA synthetase